MKDGFYNWEFEHSAGGFDKRAYIMPRMIPLLLKMSYTYQYGEPVVKGTRTYNVVRLSRFGFIDDDFIHCKISGFHQWIGAN